MEISNFINDLSNNKDIRNIYNLITELKISLNQKEDDIKNILNEKDTIIQSLNEKILNQDQRIEINKNEIKNLKNKIQNNENEIKYLKNRTEKSDNELKILNYKIEELIKKNDKECKNNENKINLVNNTLSNHEKNITQISNILNEEEKKKFLIPFNDRSVKQRLYKEICKLEDLEKKYGYLTSIGIKLLFPKNSQEIEGFIKAPENSPYKNGIFNFLIKYSNQNDYPKERPKLYMKTKIIHYNARNDGYCCIDFFSNWNSESDLSQILSVIYEFFISNNRASSYPDVGFYSVSQFEQKCKEYIDQYGYKNFNSEIDYLFQGKYNENNNNNNSDFIFVFINSINKINDEKRISKDIIIKQNIDINKYFNFDKPKAFIVGNKVFRDTINLKDFLDYKIIFVIPRIMC